MLEKAHFPVLRIITLLIAVSLLAAESRAAWLRNGVPVCTYPPCQEANPAIASDNAGGVFVVWEDYRSNAAPGIYAQHLTADGAIGR